MPPWFSAGARTLFKSYPPWALRLGQTVGGQLYRAGAIVFKPQHHKTVLCINCHADEPFFRVRLGGNALGGVIQRRSDDRAYFPCREEIQQLAVGYAGHIDAVLLAVQAFRGQQRVQNRVAGLVLGLILADAALHLGQGRVLFGLIALGTDGRNLHFQFVVAPVDKADVFFALFVLLVLAAQTLSIAVSSLCRAFSRSCSCWTLKISTPAKSTSVRM